MKTRSPTGEAHECVTGKQWKNSTCLHVKAHEIKTAPIGNVIVGSVPVVESTEQNDEPTPCVFVSILMDNGLNVLGNIRALPDSGSPVCIMAESIFRRLGFKKWQLQPALCKLSSCEQEELTLLGKFICTIRLGDVEARRTPIFVSKNTQGFVMGWRTCQQLKIIPDDFPTQIASVNVTSDVDGNFMASVPEEPSDADIANTKTHLLQVFADVFDAGKLKPMKGEPIKIHLKENAVPYAVTAARQIPFAFRDQVKSEIARLCDEGIIEKLGDVATDWCHPLVVVSKPNGSIRL